MPIEVDWIQILRCILTSMSNTTLKRSMDLVKVELDSDSESQPETSSTEARETDLKQEKPPAPFAFVAVTEVANMYKMEYEAYSESHSVPSVKVTVGKVEAYDESSDSTTDSEEIKEDVVMKGHVPVNSGDNQSGIQAEEIRSRDGKETNCNTEAKQFKCDVCDMAFLQNQNLKRHYRTHTGEKPYRCSICNMFFSQSQNLKRHYATHSREKPFRCDVCEKLFSDSLKLKLHYRIHTGEKPYKCDVCSKEFSYSLNFNRHYRVHTGEKPYECKICKRQFSQSRNLKVHIRIHTGERPYKCELCSKRFNTRGNLKIHHRTHTGEKPFGCELCKRKFAAVAHVKNHYRKHMYSERRWNEVTKLCGAEPFLRSHGSFGHSRISQHITEPDGSLPSSQEPSTGPYPEPDKSIPSLFIYKIHFNVILSHMSTQ